MNKFTKTDYFDFIDRTFADLRALIEKKNNDYTAGNQEADPFRNFREAEDFGIDPLAGLANRMSDKFNRIKSFCKTGDLAVKTEGVEDAFKDMIGYSLLALGMLAEAERIGDPGQLGLRLESDPDVVGVVAGVGIKRDIETEDDAIGYYLLGPGEIIKKGDEWQEEGCGDEWFACISSIGLPVNSTGSGRLWDDSKNSSNVKVRRIVKGGAK